MAKKQKLVEAWIKRIDTDEHQFLFRDAETNKKNFESQLYSRRYSAKLGAKRYAKKNNIKIVKWLPKA